MTDSAALTGNVETLDNPQGLIKPIGASISIRQMKQYWKMHDIGMHDNQQRQARDYPYLTHKHSAIAPRNALSYATKI
jgi:hypothetical protein